MASRSQKHAQLLLLLRLLLVVGLLPLAAFAGGHRYGEWVNHGGGLRNQRHALGERKISPATVKNLKLKWEFVTGGDVSATPAIYDGRVYFPGWNGVLYAVEQETGAQVWANNLTQLTGYNTGALATLALATISVVTSRSTPVVYGDVLLVGLIGPAAVIAVDRHTGSLLWKRVLDAHPYAVVTQGGTAYKGSLYVSVSSFEEVISIDPTYPCCSFIGSVHRVDIATGAVVWSTRTLPDNRGRSDLYAGGAVWGSSPAVDPRRGLVYIATGNTYRAPPAVTACAQNLSNSSSPSSPPPPPAHDPCVEPDNHANSVLALTLATGAIRWARSFGGFDAWTYACLAGGPNCPPGPADDYDFGECPMLLTVPVPGSHGHKRDIAVVAQKSGIVWAVDRDTGAVAWDAVTGPGGRGGGPTWGSATDGARVYVNNANTERKNLTLQPSGTVIAGGGAWAAVAAATGAAVWATPTPDGAGAAGPVTVANGVVLASSNTGGGDVYAVSAETGAVLWHSDVPVGTVRGGFSVSRGCAFVGAGYVAGGGTPGTSLYAFCVD